MYQFDDDYSHDILEVIKLNRKDTLDINKNSKSDLTMDKYQEIISEESK